MSIRSEIEQLKSICCGLIERDAVLRIIDANSAPAPAVWRDEFTRLSALDALDVKKGDHYRYKLLCELAAVADAIGSGQPEIMIPYGLTLYMVDNDGDCHPPGRRTRTASGDWITEDARSIYICSSEYILSAIDEYGSALVAPR